MKTRRLFSKTLLALTIAATSFFIVSCDNDNDGVEIVTYNISGSATGAQENPPVTTTATATLSGTYNRSTNLLTYSITWTGLSGNVTAAHFHGPAAVGANASPLHDISVMTNGVSGTAGGTITLSEAEETHLLDGKVYYNIHTAANPNGEIRAQVALNQ